MHDNFQEINMYRGYFSVLGQEKDVNGGLTLSQTTNFRLCQTERVCSQQFQI